MENDNKWMSESDKAKSLNEITSQEQSTAAPTVPGEDNGAEQPVAESAKTNELNDDTEPSKDDKATDDQRVPEGDGEPENAKDEVDRKVDRKVKDPWLRYLTESVSDSEAEARANAYIIHQLKKIQRSFIPRYED